MMVPPIGAKSTIQYFIDQGSVTNFRQVDEEYFWRALDRFEDLLIEVPEHGFDNSRLLHFFTKGLQGPSRESICRMQLNTIDDLHLAAALGCMLHSIRSTGSLAVMAGDDPSERVLINFIMNHVSAAGTFKDDPSERVLINFIINDVSDTCTIEDDIHISFEGDVMFLQAVEALPVDAYWRETRQFEPFTTTKWTFNSA